MNLTYYDRMALASYTSAERQALYQMVCGMMIIDKNVDPREKRMVEEIVSVIGLSEYERSASRNVPTESHLRTLKAMETVKKCYVAKFLAQVALADGAVTREEDAFFSYYTNLLGLPSDPDNL